MDKQQETENYKKWVKEQQEFQKSKRTNVNSQDTISKVEKLEVLDI